jgi:ribosome biogenesis protein YTM1
MTSQALSEPVAALATSSGTAQVRVQFTTRDPTLSLPPSTGPILVPSNLRRYGLSQIINHLLNSEKPTPLDFLVTTGTTGSNFLRGSVDDFLLSSGQSAEQVLTLEYVRAFIPPLYLASFEHDDWVSSVDILSSLSPAAFAASEQIIPGQERILSASYDGLLRVWNLSSQILTTSSGASQGGHTAGIKSARFISPSIVVSAGLDRTVRLWKYSEDASDPNSAKLVPQLELFGHTASIDHISVHSQSSKFLSASSDGTVCLWSTKKSLLPSASPTLLSKRFTKRQRLSTTASNLSQRGPLYTFNTHTAPVTAAIFDPKDSSVGYSASWDHTLVTWDLTTAQSVTSRTLANPLLSLLALPKLGLLATGTSARAIALVDPRVDAVTAAVASFKNAHANVVSALAVDPSSEFRFSSASHDGTIKVWDVRSVRTDLAGAATGDDIAKEGQGQSVYTLRRERRKGAEKDQNKVFDLCWDASVGILSAGEDKRVQIHRPGSGTTGQGGDGEDAVVIL